MSVQLTDKSIIYIACPAQQVTGGPEAAHQLFYKLRALGLNAQMYYFPGGVKAPVADRFLEYRPTYVTSIVDESEHLFIVPEVSTDLLSPYRKIRKAIWWLSIDNYHTIIDNERELSKLKTIKRIITKKRSFSFDDQNADKYFHFAQSRYAYEVLKSKGLKNIYFLSDYLNSSYFNNLTKQKKLNQVLYNPRKGIENTQLLMKASPELKWVPLENMTVTEVKTTLSVSKVYVDFGTHPGKDRFPREAVLNGCCIITGRAGSANFYEDVPIPDKYKFENVVSSRGDIISLIKDCFTNYDVLSQDFNLYREQVMQGEQIFEKEIKEIFS